MFYRCITRDMKNGFPIRDSSETPCGDVWSLWYIYNRVQPLFAETGNTQYKNWNKKIQMFQNKVHYGIFHVLIWKYKWDQEGLQ